MHPKQPIEVNADPINAASHLVDSQRGLTAFGNSLLTFFTDNFEMLVFIVIFFIITIMSTYMLTKAKLQRTKLADELVSPKSIEEYHKVKKDERIKYYEYIRDEIKRDCLSRSLRYAQHMVPPRPRPFPSVCDDCGECPTILGVGPVNNQGSMEALTLADIRPTFYTQFA